MIKDRKINKQPEAKCLAIGHEIDSYTMYSCAKQGLKYLFFSTAQ